MPGVIDRVLDVLDDSVAASSGEAQDARDLLAVALSLLGRIEAKVKGLHAGGRLAADPAAVAQLRGSIHRLLVLLPTVARLAGETALSSYPTGDEELDAIGDATVGLRECLACLDDPTPWAAVQFPTAAELAPGTKSPPQSWYDEDMAGLTGPR